MGEPTGTSDDEQVQTRPERWVYLGEVSGQSVKTLCSFRTEDGTRRAYRKSTKFSHLAVGYIYVVQAYDGGMRGDPAWTGDKAKDYDQIRMDARVRATQADVKSMEAKARNSDPDLDAMLAHVSEYARRYKKVSSKEALIRLIERAVWRT